MIEMYNDLGKYKTASLLKLSGEVDVCAKTYLRAFSKNKSVGLFLAGPNGVGKTYAVAAILNQIKSKSGGRIDGVLMSAPAIFERYYEMTRNNYHDGFRNQLWCDTLESVPILLFDDLGKENRTGGLCDQVLYCFGRLIRHRVGAGLSTLFTTNLRLDETEPSSIKEIYKENIDSLLCEAAPIRFELTGSDYRKSLTGGAEI